MKNLKKLSDKELETLWLEVTSKDNPKNVSFVSKEINKRPKLMEKSRKRLIKIFNGSAL